MLRSEHVAIIDILRSTVRPTVDQMTRGEVQTDAAGLHGYGYAYADKQLLGTALGIEITRLAALADGHRDYYDDTSDLNLSYTTPH